MTKHNKLCEFIIISIFSFTIVIALFNVLSIEFNVYDIRLYLMLLMTIVLIYKPLRISIFRLIFFSLIKSIFIIKNIISNKELMQKDFQEIEKLNGLDFDYLLKNLFEMRGYIATVTTGMENQRANLILWKGTKKYIVKTNGISKRVCVRDVQAILTSRKNYGADEVLVVTNHYFSNSAIKFAKINNITLIDHDQLIHMMNNSEKKLIFQTALSFIIHK